MKKKIAVLHAQVPFSSGGAELLVKNLVEQLNIFGYHAEIISLPFKWYPQNALYNSMLLWRLLDLSEINGEKIDLVISTKFPTYGIEHDNKVVWLMHQHRVAYDLYNNRLSSGFGTIDKGVEMQAAVAHYDQISLSNLSNPIFTISKNVSQRLKKYNNLSSEALYPPAPIRGKYFCEEYGNYVLSVGRLDPLKRVDLLIKSLSYCDSQIKLKIAGRGSEIENLKLLAEKNGLADRIDFLGFVNDEELLELYANAFAVYFAPIDEDYGYITLESFLSKKPIITCKDSGGALEFVKDSQNGYVCNVDTKQIGEAIQSLYLSKTRCQEYGQEGYKKVKNITWENTIKRLTESIR